VKRACRHGFDAKERNYMDHFDGKMKGKERKGKENAADEITGKLAILAIESLPRRLNKMRCDSLQFFLFSCCCC